MFGLVPVGSGGQAVDVARDRGERQRVQRVRRRTQATPITDPPLSRPPQEGDLDQAPALDAAIAASWLFCPETVEHRGGIFLKRRFSSANVDLRPEEHRPRRRPSARCRTLASRGALTGV
ncbi:hypothetical protein [Nocardiopsis composta]|uniref:Uncharacterized protein n=1 Tax=Nocardiopsis composta TaxID=157465 RepID=A0A7W8QQA5_9ACTN|nr:hypothetical protein [Nocardiopsis composta]MBB5434602.1 hypothetical protein [Nocardiopsis composta]